MVLVGKMWGHLVDWAKTDLAASEPALASEADIAIPQCVDNADQAIALIRAHHATWQKGASS